MTPDIWAVWPTVSPERSRPMIQKWHEMGYKVAVLVNPPHVHTDLPEADRVIVQDRWQGFPVAVNALCAEAPGNVVVVVGDDVYPDSTSTAQEIGQAFILRFPDLFGVMQPTGDQYGMWDKCAISPWIGRRFITDAYGGGGPYWPGYFHYWSDHELQIVAEKMGVFQRRPDITQYHDHWQRKHETRPSHLVPARKHHEQDKTLFHTRQSAGFPGAFIRPTVVQDHAKAWKEHYSKGPGDLESVNGYGSFLENTREIREALPAIFREHRVFTFTDVPCGDWNWMSHVDLSGIDYLGCDVVPEMIEANRRKFPEVPFKVLNLIKDLPRQSDLILCRDFLFHLPNEWVLKVLRNIRTSGSRLLLTTYFNGVDNTDLPMDGTIRWRSLNLRRPPFNLPRPISFIQENDSHACRGRRIGLWDVKGLPE